jgi:hypothetical protein
MRLTNFQKTVVNSILVGQCSNIESFLNEYGELTQEKAKGNSFLGDHISFDKDSIIYVPKNRDLTLTRIKEFVSLWDRLQVIGLIYTVSLNYERRRLFPLFMDTVSPDSTMLSIIHEQINKDIVPLPELKDFVARGFLTTEEYFLQEENRDRKNAQRWTKIIALISILATLFSALFQYFTYRTDRNVVIKNDHAFSDTTKVIIIDTKPLPKDTLHVQNNKNKIKFK